MDDELFNLLYRLVTQMSASRRKYLQYSNARIMLLYFWAVIRNKPVSWVCQRRNLPKTIDWGNIPSPSTVSRRLRTEAVIQLFDRIEDQVRDLVSTAMVGCWLIDAKPLPISPYTKDKQAKRGWSYDGFSKGYKLHALCDLDQNIVAWQVHAMNQAEQTVAKSLIEAIDHPGYLLGDSVYDTNDLHQLTDQRQVQLIAPRKNPGGNIGVRARHPHRLHAIAMLETYGNHFGPDFYEQRNGIERLFARLTCQQVGLDHLPNWIRTLPRVRRYIQAKLILYAIQK